MIDPSLVEAAIGGLAVVTVAALIVQKVIERIRDAFPSIEGTVVNLLSWGLGIGLAFIFGIHFFEALLGGEGAIADAADHILTGFGIGSGASFFADWRKGKLGL